MCGIAQPPCTVSTLAAIAPGVRHRLARQAGLDDGGATQPALPACHEASWSQLMPRRQRKILVAAIVIELSVM